jgi:hypothetical protein
MKLKLIRKSYTARTTTGELFIDDNFFCYTLEDTVRAAKIKVKAETAIPAATYKVNVTFSSRFNREMPMIFTESNGYELKSNGIIFKGIRLHGGNTHTNTEGCILVAHKKINNDTIQGTAEKDLTDKLKGVKNLTIEIVNEPQTE